jgi:hypothetical protein
MRHLAILDYTVAFVPHCGLFERWHLLIAPAESISTACGNSKDASRANSKHSSVSIEKETKMKTRSQQLVGLLVLATILLCAACAPVKKWSAEYKYVPPVLGSFNAATIRGSQSERKFFDDMTAYVYSIDGKIVDSYRAGWNSDLAIPVGKRRIYVVFQTGDYGAGAFVEFDALLNTKYEVKFRTKMNAFTDSSPVEFFIVNQSTQLPVAPVALAYISAQRILQPEFE